MSLSSSAEERAALRIVRQRLLALHKTLLDHEREKFEREHGPIESAHSYLHLVMEHPSFVWLRPLSALIARLDEGLLGKEPLSSAATMQLATEARALTTVPEEKTEYQELYHRALETNPAVLGVHADLAPELARLIRIGTR